MLECQAEGQCTTEQSCGEVAFQHQPAATVSCLEVNDTGLSVWHVIHFYVVFLLCKLQWMNCMDQEIKLNPLRVRTRSMLTKCSNLHAIRNHGTRPRRGIQTMSTQKSPGSDQQSVVNSPRSARSQCVNGLRMCGSHSVLYVHPEPTAYSTRPIPFFRRVPVF
ncbi:hypothetical protein BDW22DRAFT_1357445 [Trametopsis cervina]|nr:hypothetical protein BDW22DRAFT_1357445 [Trametopsis cervina]